MATVSITIDDALVPKLLPVVTDALRALGGDTSGTAAQVAKKYLAAHLRQLYIQAQLNNQLAGQTNTIKDTATTEAGVIT